MKIRFFSPLLFAASLFATSCLDGDYEPKPPRPTPEGPGQGETFVYHERAREIFDLVNQYYKITTGAATGLYKENYPAQSGDPSVSYLWPFDGMVSGAASLYRLGYEDIGYAQMVDRFDAYWRTSSEFAAVAGFGSSTNGTTGGGTRFYDDNSIAGLDLIEAYKLTGEERFKQKAGLIVDFLLSGEDNTLGGGLWWNEAQKNQPGVGDSNKPSCSNGYAINFLLEYHSICPQSDKTRVLDFAKRLYSWLKTNLRDTDGCYLNDKNANGTLNYTKWTYNTGVMISNGVLLFKITADETYLNDAKGSAEGAYNFFVKPLNGLALAYPDHDPWFTTKLVKAFMEIEPYYPQARTYINTFVFFADHAYENARTSLGFFYEDWTGTAPKRASQLLMQAAAIESLGLIAEWKGETIEEE